MFKSIFVFAFGVDDGLVVEEARGTDQHEAVLFDAGAGTVPFHLESAGPFTALALIHKPFI